MCTDIQCTHMCLYMYIMIGIYGVVLTLLCPNLSTLYHVVRRELWHVGSHPMEEQSDNDH